MSEKQSEFTNQKITGGVAAGGVAAGGVAAGGVAAGGDVACETSAYATSAGATSTNSAKNAKLCEASACETSARDITCENPQKSDLQNMPELVIVSGMSGAGRTEAMHVFEDLGYFCVDNLPASLLGNLFALGSAAELPGQQNGKCRIAVVCDARNRSFFQNLSAELAKLDEQNINYRILFLDAADSKLIARYKSSRRRHPLCDDGTSIAQGIQRERSLLYSLREAAGDVIDTTDMLPQQLRSTIRELFATGQERKGLAVSVYSFGFKHGAPLDADVVMDVRFLPNPYYDAALRPLTGLDAPVRDYVLYREETIEFIKRWHALLDCVMPGYVAEGKQQLAIGIGCTGGQHRSVALAEETGNYLKSCGYRVSVAHRDLKLAATGNVGE